MTFNSLFFLFVFLPLSLLLYYVVPKKYRTIPMIVVSLLFYAWGTPQYLLILAFSVLFNYITGLEISYFKEEGRPVGARVTMILAVVVNLLLLGFFKYYGFLIDNINAVSGLHLTAPKLALPLGISFYTFTVLSYVFDIYRDRAEVQRNFLTFTVYVTFFPKIISGPIVQYKDMAAQLDSQTMAPAKFGAGLNLFLVGLFKKVLLADRMGSIFSAISGLSAMSAGTAWLGMILYGFQLYFDFSGYSDMAIGAAKMFGFEFLANFDYPYCADSVAAFWRRWHMSLGFWFRTYIYIPLGGSRCGTARTICNLLLVWLLTGIWHGAAATFVVWGLYYGLLLILEKFVLRDVLARVPAILRRVLTFLLVVIGWVPFFSDTLGQAGAWLARMFSAGQAGFVDAAALYYLRTTWPVLLIAVFAALPYGCRFGNRFFRAGRTASMVSSLYFIGLLLLCIAGMVNGTYVSFLYAQF